jgi:hypothetical protein
MQPGHLTTTNTPEPIIKCTCRHRKYCTADTSQSQCKIAPLHVIASHTSTSSTSPEEALVP